ncbi:DNA primase [Streptomyces sp. NPDC007100]|uniref:DNA primase n=1 Tax=Streptomyces sp. NPDC007100 TaxID=3155602 RepID=UPI0033C5C22F
MKNRPALVLAVAGGYLLGRTKKAKLAIGIGSMVLGKRLNLSPQQLLSLVNDQIAANPQLKELREQLRGDLKGVGKAATGALVTKRLDSLADSLHERTLNVRDQLDAGETGRGGKEEEESSEPPETSGSSGGSRGTAKKQSARSKAPAKPGATSGAGDAPERRKRPAKQASAAPKKTAAKSASAAKKTARASARRTGGEDRG